MTVTYVKQLSVIKSTGIAIKQFGVNITPDIDIKKFKTVKVISRPDFVYTNANEINDDIAYNNTVQNQREAYENIGYQPLYNGPKTFNFNGSSTKKPLQTQFQSNQTGYTISQPLIDNKRKRPDRTFQSDKKRLIYVSRAPVGPDVIMDDGSSAYTFSRRAPIVSTTLFEAPTTTITRPPSPAVAPRRARPRPSVAPSVMSSTTLNEPVNQLAYNINNNIYKPSSVTKQIGEHIMDLPRQTPEQRAVIDTFNQSLGSSSKKGKKDRKAKTTAKDRIEKVMKKQK
jgi:hypothetical protein